MPSAQASSAGQTVIEATSGNTGIGLAMVCAQKGYPLVVTMAETFSVERRRLMRFLGAKVVLTPAAKRGIGMVLKAIELAQNNGWFLTRQFENEANADMHSRTTAREIIADFAGERLDYWVTGLVPADAQGCRARFGQGASGDKDRCLRAAGRAVLGAAPHRAVKMDRRQPRTLRSSRIRCRDGRPILFRSSPMTRSRWTPSANHSHPQRRRAALEPGARTAGRHLCRITAGGTFAGALKVCAEAPKGATVLCMLPDTGERYLSTPLFADIPAEMNEAEIAISRSTPLAQMGT